MIARPFLVRQAASPHDPDRVWAVKQGARWRFATDLCIQVTVLSLVDPVDGPCLSGVGVVRALERGRLVITA